MALYLLNSLITPVDFEESITYNIKLTKIDIETARKIVREESFISGIGHSGTAQILSELLQVEVPFNRIMIKMKKGDRGLHFVLKIRLAEGQVLTKEELEKLPYDLVLSEVI
jgi:hypothetical protein